MRIVTFFNTTADAPPGHEACAIFFNGKVMHPVIVWGSTEEAARAKAETWLAAEIEKAKPKEPKPKKAPVAAPAPVREAI